MHVDGITARTIMVNGDLIEWSEWSEWTAVPPQRILASESGPTTTEAT